MSSTMALNTDQGKLFLKRYEPASDLDLNPSMHIPRIAFTHAVQEYLGKLEFPIPRLLRNRDGNTLTVEGSDIYAIFEFVEGHGCDVAQPTRLLQSAGETLGRIHRELHGFQPTPGFKWLPMHEEVINLLRLRLERIRITASETDGYPVSQKQIDEWMGEVGRLAAELSESYDGNWIIHGDYRAQNLKFDAEGKVKAILDLDTARPADRSFDLAYALVFFPAVYQDTPLTSRQKSIFLEAYEASLSFDDLRTKRSARSSQTRLPPRHDAVAAPPRPRRHAGAGTSVD